MSSFGKLTDYFNRRKSREELRRGRRESRRSGSYCCTVAEARSLERKLQRPLLAKSRTLPSIPQSPTVARVLHSDLLCGSPARRKLPSISHPKACTLPPAGEAWRLEDDDEEGEEEAGRLHAEARPRSQSPFSHFRSRAAYLRKSISVDDHLGMVEYAAPPAEGKSQRSSKGKLKRKFECGELSTFKAGPSPHGGQRLNPWPRLDGTPVFRGPRWAGGPLSPSRTSRAPCLPRRSADAKRRRARRGREPGLFPRIPFISAETSRCRTRPRSQ
ncbi:hypothetical protein AAFF_G00405830 [Aldrovandia affinis]|uniref:Uncharacterized protein n=1 Tax=Aldrovandia affinis TaxID=143900 RepID=A0AAD7WK59_9TELE|nr:hypothetical protein AAFF_G00405830 [Aldrovandia affinis]